MKNKLTPGHEPIVNEYGPSTPEYQREAQILIDRGQFYGTGQPPMPERIKVVEYDDCDDVMTIYRPKKG